MKFFKRIITLVIFGALVGGTVYGVKSLNKGAPEGSKGTLTQVQNVQFDPETLTFSWDAVEHAKQYEVEYVLPKEHEEGVDNYCSQPTTELTLKIAIQNAETRLKGVTMKYKVRALKTKEGYAAGEWSVEQTYTFPPAA